MKITVLYLEILTASIVDVMVANIFYWLRWRVANKLNLRPSNLQLMPWHFQIQYSYLLSLYDMQCIILVYHKFCMRMMICELKLYFGGPSGSMS